MLRIRLARKGSKKRPYYRIVVADLARGRGGNIVDMLGTYDPKRGAAAKIDRERATDWVSKGALASDTVRSLLEENATGPAQTGD